MYVWKFHRHFLKIKETTAVSEKVHDFKDALYILLCTIHIEFFVVIETKWCSQARMINMLEN